MLPLNRPFFYSAILSFSPSLYLPLYTPLTLIRPLLLLFPSGFLLLNRPFVKRSPKLPPSLPPFLFFLLNRSLTLTQQPVLARCPAVACILPPAFCRITAIDCRPSTLLRPPPMPSCYLPRYRPRANNVFPPCLCGTFSDIYCCSRPFLAHNCPLTWAVFATFPLPLPLSMVPTLLNPTSSSRPPLVCS